MLASNIEDMLLSITDMLPSNMGDMLPSNKGDMLPSNIEDMFPSNIDILPSNKGAVHSLSSRYFTNYIPQL